MNLVCATATVYRSAQRMLRQRPQRSLDLINIDKRPPRESASASQPREIARFPPAVPKLLIVKRKSRVSFHLAAIIRGIGSDGGTRETAEALSTHSRITRPTSGMSSRETSRWVQARRRWAAVS